MRSNPLFEVRCALVGDALALAILESEARIAITEFRGHQRVLEGTPIIGELWVNVVIAQAHLVVVAEVSGQIVGYVKSDIDTVNANCLISQIYVDPQARQLGIGLGLVNKTTALAKSLQCLTLDAIALPGDRRMKNLYERVGMPARLIVASKNI